MVNLHLLQLGRIGICVPLILPWWEKLRSTRAPPEEEEDDYLQLQTIQWAHTVFVMQVVVFVNVCHRLYMRKR